MTPQRSSAATLDHVREVVGRLGPSRNAEDLAADLLDAWGASQDALRSLIGPTPLSGQALIRELRQREMLTLDQAHGLVDFSAARDRAQHTDYQPSAADIAAAQAGLQQLEVVMSQPVSYAPPRATTTGSTPVYGPPRATPPAPAPSVPEAISPVAVVKSPRPVGPLVFVAIVLVFAIAAAFVLISSRSGGKGLFSFGGPSALERGVAAYASGDRAGARAAFTEAAQKDPKAATPHVYLGRMAREEGDAGTASRELETAVRLDPKSSVAQREMAAHLLALGNLELAANFYRRAIEIDPSDRSAQGFYACTLFKMGRTEAANRFLTRAGPGPWSGCAVVAPPAAAPAPIAR
jgi:tetratricopeptide (TPR) repeat protein